MTRRVQEGSFLDRGIKVGQEYQGTVHTIQQAGMFVVIPEFEEYTRGFLHISQYPGFVPDMRQVVMEGQSVRVTVRNVEAQRLEFTMLPPKVERQPIDAFEVGQKVTGRVMGKKKFGVFVSINWVKGGAMLHKNKFRENDFHDIKTGDEVTATIIEVNKEKNQISLSQLDEVEKPLQKITMATLERDMELGGIVRDVTRVGVFVDVGAEVDGLLHARWINGGAGGDLNRLFKLGDRIRVQVERVNTEGKQAGKLDLRMDTAPERLEAVDAFADLEQTWIDGIVFDAFNWRVFVEVQHPEKKCPPVLAILEKEDAPDRRDVRPGDPVRARIQKVDVERRTLRLSLIPNPGFPDEAIPRPYSEIMAEKGVAPEEDDWSRSNAQRDNWSMA